MAPGENEFDTPALRHVACSHIYGRYPGEIFYILKVLQMPLILRVEGRGLNSLKMCNKNNCPNLLYTTI